MPVVRGWRFPVGAGRWLTPSGTDTVGVTALNWRSPSGRACSSRTGRTPGRAGVTPRLAGRSRSALPATVGYSAVGSTSSEVRCPRMRMVMAALTLSPPNPERPRLVAGRDGGPKVAHTDPGVPSANAARGPAHPVGELRTRRRAGAPMVRRRDGIVPEPERADAKGTPPAGEPRQTVAPPILKRRRGISACGC